MRGIIEHLTATRSGLLLVEALLVAVFLVACCPHSRCRSQRPFALKHGYCSKCSMHGMPVGFHGGACNCSASKSPKNPGMLGGLARFWMLKAFLGLTPEQIKQMKALKKQLWQKTTELRLRKKRAKVEMVELLKDKPDPVRLKQIYKIMLDAKVAKLRFDMQTQIIGILTAEQWRKLISSRWFGKSGWGRRGQSRPKARSWPWMPLPQLPYLP